MTNSKYSNDLTTDIVARSQGFDEGYAAGIKEGISMAIEALPERRVLPGINEEWLEAWMHMMGGTSEFNRAIDQAKANILKLKKGDV